jgi:hypothetical protein
VERGDGSARAMFEGRAKEEWGESAEAKKDRHDSLSIRALSLKLPQHSGYTNSMHAQKDTA